MMLLQAGQAGLYRRDSIWTDEIPPEMVAGCTLWIDGTDSSTLFNDSYLNGGTPSHGDEVWSIQNKIAPANGMSLSGEKPKLESPSVNGKSALRMNPASAVGGLSYYVDVAGTFSPAAMSTLVTTTTKLVIAAIYVSSAKSDTGTPWIQDAVFSDASGYMGMHVTDVGSSVRIDAYNYSGGAQTAQQTIPRNEWIIATMSHQSGQLRCRINGGAWNSQASGTTDSLAAQPSFLYAQDTSTSDFKLAHLATFNTAQTDAAISAVERWAANDLGITPWW